jgi:acyl-lipid omega-6 desaturase (Delta-12 desaturase)
MSSIADAPRVTIRSLIAALPEACYENPTWKGLAYFARDVLIYAALVAALLRTDQPLVLLCLWPVAGLAISALFVLGHDAAHGALFKSSRLCRWVGQLAMLPSLHGFDAWALGHNRIHHVHTGCEGLDFVWHPVTQSQYDGASRLRKALHRVEWSAWGAGVYYLRAIWWGRLVRVVPPERYRAGFRRGRLIVGAYGVAASAAVCVAGVAHYGDAAGGVWMWVKVFLVPWLCWNHIIGATVYVHHIGPGHVWRRRDDWTRVTAQLETTSNLLMPRWYNFFVHNIYWHVPHHVDPRIPFYNLPHAAAVLHHEAGSRVAPRRFALREYLRTTHQCKLYDFDRGVWCGYDGVPIAAAS